MGEQSESNPVKDAWGVYLLALYSARQLADRLSSGVLEDP